MRTAALRPMIDAAAEFVGLPAWHYQGHKYAPGVWLEGQILQESGGDPRAMRYEGHLDKASPGDADAPDDDDGLLEDDRSYGLMQILGANARALAGIAPHVPMNFGWLLLPMANMAFGLRWLLMELRATDGNVSRGLARYNHGPKGEWTDTPDRRMRAQGYVDLVARQAALAQADRERR